jgi:cytochrome c-type biogenesis protein CcmF
MHRRPRSHRPAHRRCTFALIASRIGSLKSDHKLSGLLGREVAFLAANILLVAIAAVVLIGTVFPAITGAITGTRTTLGPTFYNKVFGPVAMLIVALMATGPLQGYDKEAARRLMRGVIVPAVAAIFAGGAIWFYGIHNDWALACGAIAVAAVVTVVLDFAHAVILRSRIENSLLAVVRVLKSNHRRYGAQLSHLGVVMIVVGVTGSAVFSKKQTFQLDPGSSGDFSGIHLTLNSIKQSQGPNYTMIEATLTAADAAGRLFMLTPQRRFYDKWEDQPNSVVAIQSSWKQDLYVTLSGWEQDGKNIVIEVIVNPLVSWLWIGGWVVAIGGVICLIPQMNRAPVKDTAENPMNMKKPALVVTAAAVACAFVLPIFSPASARAQANPQLPPGHPDLS